VRGRHRLVAAALSILLLAGCGGAADDAAPVEGRAGPAGPADLPEVDLAAMEPQVAERFRESRQAVLADPLSAAAWGRFGMVAHAHELFDEAAVAYRRAQALDSADVRWPYFLGDVLSVQGEELDAAEAAFRRALELEPDYAPAHWRLGAAAIAQGRPEAAARALERALELAPDLQPARLALAQVRLSEGELEGAESLLRELLHEQPEHAQALSTLAQVAMRQGRGDEARRIAERAEAAPFYNLYSDPLMDQVVTEGVSAVLIWERARAFLQNGKVEQAAIGLSRVVELQPDNADAHHQLALAYRNLGRPAAARRHLERVVALQPELVDARIQLAGLLLDEGRGSAAIPHLEKLTELAPHDPDADWYLGRAMVQAGDPGRAVEIFARAAAKAGAAGTEPPVWALNEWGSALARLGRMDVAEELFRRALAAAPEDAQALFHLGLVHEARGSFDEAVGYYCRSTRSRPGSPAEGRLQALGRRCPG
jgi:tetratricopeptide (TPR) repeat protein